MSDEPTGARAEAAAGGAVRAGLGASLARFVPILAWAPAYQPAWLTKDVVAGFTIWGLLIPEMIAYASLAGLPPQAGLYTLLASLGLHAIFGSSRQLVVAGTSASAVLVFSAVTALHPTDPAAYATLAAGLVILTGLLFVAAGLLKLGFITQFLSRPVMEGFVFGLAIFVTVSQLLKLFGLAEGPGDIIPQFGHLLANLGHASWTTLAVGVIALGLLSPLANAARHRPGIGAPTRRIHPARDRPAPDARHRVPPAPIPWGVAGHACQGMLVLRICRASRRRASDGCSAGLPGACLEGWTPPSPGGKLAETPAEPDARRLPCAR